MDARAKRNRYGEAHASVVMCSVAWCITWCRGSATRRPIVLHTLSLYCSLLRFICSGESTLSLSFVYFLSDVRSCTIIFVTCWVAHGCVVPSCLIFPLCPLPLYVIFRCCYTHRPTAASGACRFVYFCFCLLGVVFPGCHLPTLVPLSHVILPVFSHAFCCLARDKTEAMCVYVYIRFPIWVLFNLLKSYKRQ
jgi:hypothetical protein